MVFILPCEYRTIIAAGQEREHHGQEKETLLLVEDEALIAMAQKMYLEKYGYKVLTTPTGEKAIGIIKDDNQHELAYVPESKKAPLEKSGYSVITANIAEKAVELFQKHSEIDLVLMDIDLGKGMDGTQAAGRSAIFSR